MQIPSKGSEKKICCPNSKEYLELNHFDVPQGRWTTIEFLALLVIIRKKKLTEIVIQKKIDETKQMKCQ